MTMSQFARTIYNSWLPAYLMRYVPRRVDQLSNVMIAMQWTKAMGKLMERSITIGKDRANANPGTDPTKWHLDPKQRIQPAELEMTPAQMNLLRSLQCRMMQGYLISRPMPGADLPAWVAEHVAVPSATAAAEPLALSQAGETHPAASR